MGRSDASEPLQVIEDIETGNRFVIYTNKSGISLELKFDGEAPWFSRNDLSAMFGVTAQAIDKHLRQLKDDGEIDASTTNESFVVQFEGNREVRRPVTFYGLDVAFYVGYRVNSSEGKLFRRWSTSMLVQLATKGFVVDQRRLKSGGSAERVRELREIIRDLRSEEANLYAELRDICAMCQDYDRDSEAARTFYQRMQAKLFYAVTSHTPAQLIKARADADQPNMGLQNWAGDRLLQSDVTVGKNYLAGEEMRELNRLTGIVLDIFEDQLDLGRLTMMSECLTLLDQQLSQLGRAVLKKPPPPKKELADEHAKAEYKKFHAQRRIAAKAETDAGLAGLRAVSEQLPKPTTGRKRKGG